MSKGTLPVFFSKSFIESSLTSKPLNYFELIFLYGVRKCSNFILLNAAVQFSQHQLLKRVSFIHCIFLSSLSKIRCPYRCSFILGLLSSSISLHTYLLWQYHTVLITITFVVSSEVKKLDSSRSNFLSQVCFSAGSQHEELRPWQRS